MQVLSLARKEFLHQRHTDSLRDAALDLSFDQSWVNGAAHIVRGSDLEHSYRPQFDINFDLGEVRAKSKHGVRYALTILIKRAGRRIESSFGSQNVSVSIEGQTGEADDSASVYILNFDLSFREDD